MTVRPVAESDLRWQAAADELAPHKSLQRISSNARSVVSTIAVVATLLAGLGTFAASQLTNEPGLLAAAAASVFVATLAAALSLSILVNRGDKIALSNLTAVKKWYEKELGKGNRAALGGVLLIIAVLIAGLTSTIGLAVKASDRASDGNIEARMNLTASKEGGSPRVHIGIKVLGVPGHATVIANLKDSHGSGWFNAAIQPEGGIATIAKDLEVRNYTDPLTLDVTVMDDAKTLKSFELVTHP